MRLHYKDENVIENLSIELDTLIENKLNEGDYSNIVIFCIGTDRNIPDSLGPFVGEFLSDSVKDYSNDFIKVYGTLNNPVHALNLKEKVENLDSKDSLIIAIDACLGSEDGVGDIVINEGYIRPGYSQGKNLPTVGEICIKGITLSDDDEAIFNNTRLSFVYNMAKVISNIIQTSIERHNNKVFLFNKKKVI